MRYASSQEATCSESASASEYTATVRMPSRLAVRATRQAISPRLAIRILSNMRSAVRRAERKDVTHSTRRTRRNTKDPMSLIVSP